MKKLQDLFFICLGLLVTVSGAHAQKPLNEKWRAKLPFELVHPSNFDQKVGLDLNPASRDQLYIVQVTASWCKWCPAVEKQLVEAKKTLKDKITIYQFDHDEGVVQIMDRVGGMSRSTPGVTLFKNGIVIGQLSGYEKDVIASKWILEMNAQQITDQMQEMTVKNFSTALKVKDKWILVLIWNGNHMWGEDNRKKAHDAKLALGDRLQIYQFWTGAIDVADFLRKQKMTVENYVGLSVVLIRNQKVRARVEGQAFEGSMATWIQNEGPSIVKSSR